MATALDFARRCDPPVYLSNAEKEALFLTGYGDVPPWAVQQGLEQALARGAYVPGEEALRMRLEDALDLEERLAGQVAKDAEDAEFASNLQQGPLEGINTPDGNAEDTEAQEVTGDDQEASREPPADEWRSPLEIVAEGAEEPEQEPAGEGDAAPAAVAQRIEDRDFSSCTKPQLLTFAADHFGVQLKLADSKDELIAQVQRLVDEANEEAV